MPNRGGGRGGGGNVACWRGGVTDGWVWRRFFFSAGVENIWTFGIFFVNGGVLGRV